MFKFDKIYLPYVLNVFGMSLKAERRERERERETVGATLITVMLIVAQTHDECTRGAYTKSQPPS